MSELKKEIINGKEINVIENVDDVFSLNSGKEIKTATEYDGYYYLRFEPEDLYDESMYKIDKKTLKAECMHLIFYFPVEDKATPIDPSVLTSLSKAS